MDKNIKLHTTIKLKIRLKISLLSKLELLNFKYLPTMCHFGCYNKLEDYNLDNISKSLKKNLQWIIKCQYNSCLDRFKLCINILTSVL